jgi:hypothetical protein
LPGGAIVESENGAGGIVEHKAFRRRQGEAEPGMKETAAAHETIDRILAIEHAVDACEIGRLVALAGRRGAVLAGIVLCVLDALGRGRMGGHKFERTAVTARSGAQLGIALHGGEEPRRCERIVAGARRDTDTDAVGLEFLSARKGRKLQPRTGERERADLRIAEYVIDVADEPASSQRLLADRGMACDDMRHFVGQYGSKFGGIIGETDEPARHTELAGRQRECVHGRRIENGNLVSHVGPLGGRDQPPDHARDLGLELGVFVGAAIARKHALMLPPGGRGRLRRRLRQEKLPHFGGGRASRDGERGDQRQQQAGSPRSPRIATTGCANGHRHRSDTISGSYHFAQDHMIL